MVDHDVGIRRAGGYVPRVRLERSAIARAHEWFNPGLGGIGKGTRAIANWDEDAITLAVEAARDCLDGLPAPSIDTVMLASTTLPFADRQNAGVVKSALDLPDAVVTLDLTGSQKAGTSALLSALRMAQGGSGPVLCIAAEKSRPQPGSESEMIVGDGAAAFLIGAGDLTARLLGARSVSVDFVDHFRANGAEFDYGWESRWIRDEGYGGIVVDAVRAAIESSSVDPRTVTHFLMPSPMSGVARRIARDSSIVSEAVAASLNDQIGHARAAHPLIALAHCLESAKAGDRLVVVGFGQGCDVLIFEATGRALQRDARTGIRASVARGKVSSNYMRYLVVNGLLPIDRGMRAETDMKTSLSALYRDRRTVLGLVGGRDRRTGVPQFPRSEISVGARSIDSEVQEDYRFAEVPGHVVAFTSDALAYSIDPPAIYGMIDFEGGGRMAVDFTDIDVEEAKVGRRMRMTFRIKALDEQRHFVRYFWKATPVRAPLPGIGT
jgi:hydroxymethylglutaryl-CoA synthase